MDKKIELLFENLDYSKQSNFKNITVIPIIGLSAKLNFIGLERAIKKELAEIVEIDKSGSVPELKFINKSGKMIFIWDGEELKGGKQNRVINTSILVRANSELSIPVSCVEQGRWHYNNSKFESSEYSVPMEIRKMKNSSVRENLMKSNSFYSNQHEVWNNIEKYSLSMKAKSKTMAVSEIMESHREEIDRNINNIQYNENQTGVLIAINNEVVGVEYISKKKVFKELYNKILMSYSSDNLELSDTVFDETKLRESISAFLDNLKSTMTSEFESLGVGREKRFDNNKVEAVTLEHEEEIIYFSAYKK